MDFTEILQGTNFSAIDWAIVIAYPLISVALGIFASRFIVGMDDFVVAGRGIRTALGVATLTGTELGLVTVMYSAQKGFTGGFAAFHIGLAAGVVAFFVGMTGFIIAELRKHEVVTISEYYGKRYSTGVRVAGGAVLAFGGILNMGMFLKAGSIFLVGITGLPPEGNALTIVMLVLLVLVLTYTIMGGMISVVLADYVQFVVLSFGLLVATWLAISKMGWDNIFSTVEAEMGIDGFSPLASPEFGWDYMLWMCFMGLVGCAIWPTSVSRALAAKDSRTVKNLFMFSSASYAIRNIVPYFWGIGAFVLITQTPTLAEAFFPTTEGAVAVDSLYAFPLFMGRILPPVLIGIISAAMLAAFMSTHDSYFLCWGSVIANDVIAPCVKGGMSQKAKVLTTRIAIFCIGVAIFAVSFAFPLKQDLWEYMAVTGAIYFSGAFALLAAGLYWKRASTMGAYGALICGCLSIVGLPDVRDAIFVSLFKFDLAWVDAEITNARTTLIVISLTCITMVIGSLMFPDKKQVEAE